MTRSLDDWLQRLESLHPKAIDLGLERCAQVYQRLGKPRPAQRIWTVAGTNGKGSVTAYLSAMLEATGRTVGTYTSPHLFRFNERMRVAGLEASDNEIVTALEQVELARREISLTYFEFTTLAAFLWFSEQNLDTAVLEVGLGGRLDAVNLVDADCAVITAIGLDHQAFLGDSRESIALEKAGIMRPRRPVVIGDREPPTSLSEKIAELGVQALSLGRDFDLQEGPDECQYSGPGGVSFSLPHPPLPGGHQLDNLATAVAAIGQLLPVDETWAADFSAGIQSVRLTGRLQSPAEEPRLLLDVGHNPLAARVVATYLESERSSDVACVLAMLVDKDAEAVTRELSGQVRDWYCAGLRGERGQSGAALAQRVRGQLGQLGFSQPPVQASADVAGALFAALDAAGQSTRVLVFGSFQTVAEALKALRAQRSSPG